MDTRSKSTHVSDRQLTGGGAEEKGVSFGVRRSQMIRTIGWIIVK